MADFNYQNFIKEQWSKMPKQMQDAISKSGWSEKLKEIGNQQKLSEEEVGKLETEIMLFLLGVTHGGDFLSVLKENLKWDDKKAIKICDIVNSEIINKIIELAKADGMPEPAERKLTPEQEIELKALDELDEKANPEEAPSEEEATMVERYNILPKSIQNILSNPETQIKIKNIGDELGLTSENLSLIENEITLALLGSIKTEEIKDDLKAKGKFSEEIAQKIFEMMENNILNSVKGDLNKIAISQNISLEENLQKKFNSLSEDIKNAILSANINDKIADISQTYKLNIEQAGKLYSSTFKIILNVVKPNDFENSLKTSLGLPDEKIKVIVNSVNEKILKNIRAQLMALSGVKKEKKKESEIFGGAGIEIMPEKIVTPKEESIEKPAEMLSEVENPELITKEIQNEKILKSISAQKLSGSFTIPAVKTDYTLPSMGKDKISPVPSDKLAVDPYREIPE